LRNAPITFFIVEKFSEVLAAQSGAGVNPYLEPDKLLVLPPHI
jgi:hypothetical protein